MSAGFPDNTQTPRPLRTGTRRGGEREKQLAGLRPLIIQLIAHDPVVRSPSGAFHLRDDVQPHLELLAERTSRTVAQVYVGRSCPSCGAVTPTRLRDGVRQCDSCRASQLGADRFLVEPPPPRDDRHRSRVRWTHRAS